MAACGVGVCKKRQYSAAGCGSVNLHATPFICRAMAWQKIEELGMGGSSTSAHARAPHQHRTCFISSNGFDEACASVLGVPGGLEVGVSGGRDFQTEHFFSFVPRVPPFLFSFTHLDIGGQGQADDSHDEGGAHGN